MGTIPGADIKTFATTGFDVSPQTINILSLKDDFKRREKFLS